MCSHTLLFYPIIFKCHVNIVIVKKNTMSLHYVQSESLTSGVTVSVRCDGMSEKFQLSFYNQTVSTGDGSATLSFKAMHCCAVAQCSVKWSTGLKLVPVSASNVSVIFKSQS